MKLFSSLPEFEINEEELIIYDNPKYNKIKFGEMEGCDLIYLRNTASIVIFLNQSSKLKGNMSKFQKKIQNIPNNVHEVVWINLEFAKIKSKELKRILNERIESKAIK